MATGDLKILTSIVTITPCLASIEKMILILTNYRRKYPAAIKITKINIKNYKFNYLGL